MCSAQGHSDFPSNECFQVAHNADELKDQLIECISYVCDLKDPVRIISDRSSFRIVQFLRRNSVSFSNTNPLAKLLLGHKSAIETIVSILEHFEHVLSSFFSESNKSCTMSASYERFHFQQFDFMNELLLMIANVTNESKTFCYKFHDQYGSKILLDYLNDSHDVVEQLLHMKDKPYQTEYAYEIGYRLVLHIIQSLHNISVIADYRKKDFKELNIITTIHNIIDHIKPYDDMRILAYITLTNVVDDAEIETLPDTKLALKDIVSLIHTAADLLVDEANLVRIKIDIDFDEDNEVLCEVLQLPGALTHIVSLLVALYRISVNDRIKLEIYDTYSIANDLDKILVHGNQVEQEYGARVLWQLCFDPCIAQKVYDNRDLYATIEQLCEQDSGKIRSLCKGILWSVKKVVKPDSGILRRFRGLVMTCAAQSYTPQVATPTSDLGHIMISYNSKNRELCLQIKQELERSGHSVWIDVENISGSSLESMANAVEHSKCVLMCMTEKYKQSPNCRAEAEYAFRLNVPIIPLIMQNKGWLPDGWLGMILGSKIFVNFTKYPFDECMKILVKELNALNATENKFEKENSIESSSMEYNSTKSTVSNWTNENVRDWLAEFGFHAGIVGLLKDFDGQLLMDLNMVHKASPDYFYSAISLNRTLDLFYVLSFVHEFNKLFSQ